MVSELPSIQGLARRRIFAGAAAGFVAGGLAVLAGASWSVAVLVGWDALTLVFLSWVWATILWKDDKGTAQLALAEDDSRATADGVILGASIASLVAIFFTLSQAAKSSGGHAVFLAAFAVGSVVLGWAAIQTTFTLMYARLYYTPPSGGFDFEDGGPDYRDFAYTAFTIGMTYQVSDTTVRDPRIRRTVLSHALLSYVFGVVIVGGAVNLIAGLLR
jgi:uncharacterized membrane protein